MPKAVNNPHQRWLKLFLLCTCILISGVGLFNCFVDGVGLFRLNKGLKYAAANLLNGKMIAGSLGGYDERELQKLIVEHSPREREMITIGSSRNMLVRKRFIHGNIDFFNHSMAAASLEDYIAIAGLYRINGDFPKTVVLGIDPWIFNRNNGLTPWWTSLSYSYKRMVEEIYGRPIEVDPSQPNRYLQLINLDYTIENYRFLRKGKRLYVTDTVQIDDFVREPDGSIHFPYKLRLKKDERTHPYPLDATPLGYLNHFESLSGFDLFEDFIRYLKKKGVEVVLLLLPLHPAAYKLCAESRQYQIVMIIEKDLNDLALRNNILLIGSYDPGKYKLEGKDFFDDTHGHEIVAKKVWEDFRLTRQD